MTSYPASASRSPSPLQAIVIAAALALAHGCAQLDETGDGNSGPGAAKLEQARESYVQCVNREAEKDAASPAGAEDIAVAAHARCWTAWDAYRQLTNTTFAEGARSRDEQQLAHDKADAHLRQLELDTRSTVVDRIVQRTLTQKR